MQAVITGMCFLFLILPALHQGLELFCAVIVVKSAWIFTRTRLLHPAIHIVQELVLVESSSPLGSEYYKTGAL